MAENGWDILLKKDNEPNNRSTTIKTYITIIYITTGSTGNIPSLLNMLQIKAYVELLYTEYKNNSFHDEKAGQKYWGDFDHVARWRGQHATLCSMD